MKHPITSEIKQRLSSAALCMLFTLFLLATAASAPGCSSEDSKHFLDASVVASFDTFTESLFCEEISQNMINLHFTLAHPENYGITDYEVTLGDLSMATITDSYARTENYLTALKQFNKNALPLNKQLTYDVLESDFTFSLKMAPYILYDEILAPSSGIHAQLPILLESAK